MSLKCVLIGAGNLATHLGEELKCKGFQIVQVYSRTKESAQILANKVSASYTTDPKEITQLCEVFIVALKDDALSHILLEVNFANKLIIHCSGSLHISAINKFSENTGVIYPLQTFSKNRIVKFSEIPLYIEANSDKNLELVKFIADKLSDNVNSASSEDRLVLHIAAVFACNFVNHFYSLSESILEEKGFDFDILKPLIKETANKILSISPSDAQTGPAVRYDKSIIEKHLGILDENEKLSALYKAISESIFNFHQKTK
ncbi:MAG: DUF2520 domain-containing protein [Mariniphaga sp.]|nr:DUF2520 domain-containing protein [Mariniphaga sp.]